MDESHQFLLDAINKVHDRLGHIEDSTKSDSKEICQKIDGLKEDFTKHESHSGRKFLMIRIALAVLVLLFAGDKTKLFSAIMGSF